MFGGAPSYPHLHASSAKVDFASSHLTCSSTFDTWTDTVSKRSSMDTSSGSSQPEAHTFERSANLSAISKSLTCAPLASVSLRFSWVKSSFMDAPERAFWMSPFTTRHRSNLLRPAKVFFE